MYYSVRHRILCHRDPIVCQQSLCPSDLGTVIFSLVGPVMVLQRRISARKSSPSTSLIISCTRQEIIICSSIDNQALELVHCQLHKARIKTQSKLVDQLHQTRITRSLDNQMYQIRIKISFTQSQLDNQPQQARIITQNQHSYQLHKQEIESVHKELAYVSPATGNKNKNLDNQPHHARILISSLIVSFPMKNMKFLISLIFFCIITSRFSP